jgi:hypothetical protein
MALQEYDHRIREVLTHYQTRPAAMELPPPCIHTPGKHLTAPDQPPLDWPPLYYERFETLIKAASHIICPHCRRFLC